MNRNRVLPLALLFGVFVFSANTIASEPHLISLHGYATDLSNSPVVGGSVRVELYDVPAGGLPIYNSGADFNGAILNGEFEVLLGSITQLSMVPVIQTYYMEIYINSEEVVGDNVGGRKAITTSGGEEGHSHYYLDAPDGDPEKALRIANNGDTRGALDCKVVLVECNGNDCAEAWGPDTICDEVAGDGNGTYNPVSISCDKTDDGGASENCGGNATCTERSSTGHGLSYYCNDTDGDDAVIVCCRNGKS